MNAINNCNLNTALKYILPIALVSIAVFLLNVGHGILLEDKGYKEMKAFLNTGYMFALGCALLGAHALFCQTKQTVGTIHYLMILGGALCPAIGYLLVAIMAVPMR